jgi:hypothetical protein
VAATVHADYFGLHAEGADHINVRGNGDTVWANYSSIDELDGSQVGVFGVQNHTSFGSSYPSLDVVHKNDIMAHTLLSHDQSVFSLLGRDGAEPGSASGDSGAASEMARLISAAANFGTPGASGFVTSDFTHNNPFTTNILAPHVQM